MPEDVKPKEGDDQGGDANASAKPDPMAEIKAMISRLEQGQTNLKAEFNRKLESVRPAPPPAPAKKPLQEMVFDDPDSFVREVASAVKSEVVGELKTVERNRGTAAKIYSEYPEMNDAASPLTIRANEIYGSLSAEEQADPKSLRLAVAEAAAEMGLAPKSKRKAVTEQNDDNFQLSSGGKQNQRRSKKSDEVDPSVLDSAKAMGLNTDDPAVVKRLTQRAQRTFKRWGE